MCLFNMFGFLLHLSAGAVEVVAARDAEANGAVVSFLNSTHTAIFVQFVIFDISCLV